MVHFDTKRLPLLKRENLREVHEYFFIAINDFSRELFAAILPGKTQHSSERFLSQVIEECSYTIKQSCFDNGLEYRGNENSPLL